MFLVQILLPLYDNNRQPLPREHFYTTRTELTEQFGGLTTYTRAPAEGFWRPDEGEPTSRDSMIIYEVMVPHLNVIWWRNYRRQLEIRFRQKSVIARAQAIRLL